MEYCCHAGVHLVHSDGHVSGSTQTEKRMNAQTQFPSRTLTRALHSFHWQAHPKAISLKSGIDFIACMLFQWWTEVSKGILTGLWLPTLSREWMI